MTNSIKNRLAIFVFGIAVLGLVAFSLVKTVGAVPSTVTFETSAVASTTRAFLANGSGSSTFAFDSNLFSSGKIANQQGTDDVSLYLLAEASSTATVFIVTPQYSNNGIDWYSLGSKGTASASGVVTLASTTTYSWQPSTTATTSLVLILPDVPTAHERVITTATGAAGAIYEEVDLKKNPSTP